MDFAGWAVAANKSNEPIPLFKIGADDFVAAGANKEWSKSSFEATMGFEKVRHLV